MTGQVYPPPFNEAGREFGAEKDEEKIRSATRYRVAARMRKNGWLRRLFRRRAR